MATMAVENVLESDRDELKQIIDTMWSRYGSSRNWVTINMTVNLLLISPQMPTAMVN